MVRAAARLQRLALLPRLRVSLEGDRLAIDYLDGPPPLLPVIFRFAFAPGESRAAYVVTAIGVGRRIAVAEDEVRPPGHPKKPEEFSHRSRPSRGSTGLETVVRARRLVRRLGHEEWPGCA